MSKFINCPCLQKIQWMNGFILKENGLLPQGGKRRTTREQKFWIAVRVFLFCFCFCYFYLVRRLCFSHFITKILRSLQISVYRQNVPYNVLLKAQLLHILEISTGPIKVADIFGWDKKLPKTFFQTVDDAIHYNCLSSWWRNNWFFEYFPLSKGSCSQKNKAATVFVLLFQIKFRNTNVFSFVVLSGRCKVHFPCL